MKPVTVVTGRAYPLERDNVDTDMIIRAEHMKTVVREGLGRFLFSSLREDLANPFDDEAYFGSSILIAGKNFGCGSSREHAVWALADFGIDAIIAESFSDIFAGNAFRNGILAVSLDPTVVKTLLRSAKARRPITIDLEKQRVHDADIRGVPFGFDPFRRECLLHGLNEIDLALRSEARIALHEQADLAELDPLEFAGA